MMDPNHLIVWVCTAGIIIQVLTFFGCCDAAVQVEAWALKQKVDLPADMLQTAKQFGLRASALTAYAKLQVCALAGCTILHLLRSLLLLLAALTLVAS